LCCTTPPPAVSPLYGVRRTGGPSRTSGPAPRHSHERLLGVRTPRDSGSEAPRVPRSLVSRGASNAGSSVLRWMKRPACCLFMKIRARRCSGAMYPLGAIRRGRAGSASAPPFSEIVAVAQEPRTARTQCGCRRQPHNVPAHISAGRVPASAPANSASTRQAASMDCSEPAILCSWGRNMFCRAP